MISRKNPIPLILMILLYAVPCFGQWVPEGEIIYDLQNSMNNDFLIQDGREGTFVFWTDTRAGTSIIYGQKVDTAGYKLWAPLGNFIGYSTLSYPTVGIPDGSGGAIIAWANYRAPRADIYAQHVDAYGELLWPDTGLSITNLWPGEQFQVAICEDGMGGAVMCWNGDSLGARRIIAQRVDGQGNKLWGEYGKRLALTQFDQNSPLIARAIDSVFYCTWVDDRTEGLGTGIYGQKLDINGNLLWASTGVPIATSPAIIYGVFPEYMIATNDTFGLYCIWNDGRPGGYDNKIFLMFTNSEGMSTWPTGGIRLSVTDSYSYDPFIVISSDNRAIVAWMEQVTNVVYCNIVDRFGIKQWQPAFTATESVFTFGGLSKSNSNNFEICFYSRDGNQYIIKLDENGGFVFGNSGIPYGLPNSYGYPKHTVSDGNGGVLILTSTSYHGPILLYKVYANGRVGGDTTSIDDNQQIPNKFSIQAYPNPFNAQTTIQFELPKSENIMLCLYNLTGQNLLKHSLPNQPAGINTISLDMSNYPSGVYFLKLSTSEVIAENIKLTLIK